MTAIYCGKECYRKHWRLHRDACKVEAEIRKSEQGQLVAEIRKWALIHRGILDLATTHALQLDVFPARIHTHFLSLALSRPSCSSSPTSPAFTIAAATILPLPLPAAPALKAQTAEIIKRGGLGVAQCVLTCGDARVPDACAVLERPRTRVVLTNWKDLLKGVVEGTVREEELAPLGLVKYRITARLLDRKDKYAAITWSNGRVTGHILSKMDGAFCQPLPTRL